MHKFNNHWLKLRETIDKKSRNLKVIKLINNKFSKKDCISIL